MALAAIVLGFTFTSCKEDTQPRLGNPTTFVLNTPPMSDQLYVLTENSSVNFTVSQPNYGVATTPYYQVEIAKSAEGFANDEYQIVDGTTTIAKIVSPGKEFCIAICKLFNYTTPENFDGSPRPIFVRVHAWVPNAPESSIYSNTIELKQVQPYLAVKAPDTIQLVGQPEGWSTSPNAAWLLYETEPDSRLYVGTFEIPEGQFQFRFYDQFDPDEPWEWYSIGAQDADSPVDITMTDGVYSGQCFYDFSSDGKGKGKGSWKIPNWPGGTVKMSVNLTTKAVVFETVN